MALKYTLLLLSFIGAISAQHDANFANGRSTIVHLFEWTWNDIAEECERFLGPYGYGGVQVSPVTENVIITEPFRPWYERYQTVSYNVMTTRSGTEEEFKSMVRRCNQAGVRIYPDVIVNHMTGEGSAGLGSGGSYYNSTTRTYPEYNITHFNPRSKCPSASGGIEDWNDEVQVRNCQLVGLLDLDQSIPYVRDQITGFLNKLVSYGVAGFRVDAAKHVWPQDLKAIMEGLNDLPTDHGFAPGARPFIYQEVPGGYPGEGPRASDYFEIGRVTEFNHGRFLGNVFRGNVPLNRLVNWGAEWGMHPDEYAFLFLDNHDTQRGGPGEVALTFRLSRLYKMASAFMLAHPYAVTRVMSSYYWEQRYEGNEDANSWVGPPHAANGDTLPIVINPDLTCGNGWICEHRWRQIYNMVKFRNVVSGTTLSNWWDNGNNQIAFSRGDKGFIAINNENSPLSATLQTGLPAGTYCDVISGQKMNGSCTGASVQVGSDGRANINLTNETEDPVIAIHAESKL